jgi:hypothetical protein
MLVRFLTCGLLAAIASCASPAGAPPDPIAVLRSVGPEGEGNKEAARAWRNLVERGLPALFAVLEAFDGADLRAANWLRAAVDAIAEKAIAAKEPIDVQKLESYILNPERDGRARYAAYEILVRLDPAAPDRILPRLLEDPGRELRREAVARAIAEAEKTLKAGDKKGAAGALQHLFPCSRDRDQVDAITRHLKSLGVSVDLQAHYGVIRRWAILTTFDNSGMKGFEIAYPPEKGVPLRGELAGKSGLTVRLVEAETSDPQGKLDLNATLGKEMGAVAYAFAVVESPSERPIEVRVGTNNAVKIFLNGREIFFRNEYHHGMKMDQYVAAGMLRQGRNKVLLKICQNEQKEDWAQSWSFQARLCDALGGGVPFTIVTRAEDTTAADH